MSTYFIAIHVPEKIARQFVDPNTMGKTHLAPNAYHITLGHFGNEAPSSDCINLLKTKIQSLFADNAINKSLKLIFKSYKRVNVYGEVIEKLYDIVKTSCEETQQNFTQVPEPHMTMSYQIPKQYETDYPVASLIAFAPEKIVIIQSEGAPRDLKTKKKLANHPAYKDWSEIFKLQS